MAFLYKGDAGEGLDNYSLLFSPVQGKGWSRAVDITGVRQAFPSDPLLQRNNIEDTKFFSISSSQISQNRIF